MHSDLIINNKYYSQPSRNTATIKELIRTATAEGTGRPVGAHGISAGPWTPDLLTDAISELDKNKSGVDLRTVQLWFQDNDKGVSAENIRWLSHVFGCGEAHCILEWQKALTTGQQELLRRRRRKRTRPEVNSPSDEYATISKIGARIARDPNASNESEVDAPATRFSLARKSEAMFNAKNAMNLPIAVWTLCGLLWFSTYILGVHSITYSPSPGLAKQVGFYWSISWTIGEMVFLPLFLISVSDLLSYWKIEGRPSLFKFQYSKADREGWPRRIENFSFSYWAILLICFCGIFLLQWAGVYLRPLLSGAQGKGMIDWIMVVLVKPDVASTMEMIIVSFVGFLYSGIIYWFFFVGLLLIYKVTTDFHHLSKLKERRDELELRLVSLSVAARLMSGFFRCAILGILLAITLKLNAAYLVSDGENLIIWLVQDALIFFNADVDPWNWLNQSPSPFFTSFLLLFITVFVFYICFSQMCWIFKLKQVPKSHEQEVFMFLERSRFKVVMFMWCEMVVVITILSASYFTIGMFYGFSLVLLISLILAIVSFFRSYKPLEGPGVSSQNIG